MGAASLIGRTANPHPSQAAQWVVAVVAEDDRGVRVRYVAGFAPAWWITREAWFAWEKLTG